jgi:Protein of unknown function (DUF3237)
MQAPALTYCFEVRASVDPIVSITPTRRYVPITGGTATGKVNGKIGGGFNDYQYVRPDGTLEIQARYMIETDDGAKIYVENNGIRHAPPEIVAKMMRGEKVDASLVYFRASPRFETEDPRYLWMTQSLFICTGERLPDCVLLKFWSVG